MMKWSHYVNATCMSQGCDRMEEAMPICHTLDTIITIRIDYWY